MVTLICSLFWYDDGVINEESKVAYVSIVRVNCPEYCSTPKPEE